MGTRVRNEYQPSLQGAPTTFFRYSSPSSDSEEVESRTRSTRRPWKLRALVVAQVSTGGLPTVAPIWRYVPWWIVKSSSSTVSSSLCVVEPTARKSIASCQWSDWNGGCDGSSGFE